MFVVVQQTNKKKKRDLSFQVSISQVRNYNVLEKPKCKKNRFNFLYVYDLQHNVKPNSGYHINKQSNKTQPYQLK